MQFRVVKEHHYRWPVTVRQPSDDLPGAIEETTFTAIFRMLPRARIRELSQVGPDASVDIIGTTVREALAGWRGVLGEDQQQLEFSPETLDAAMANPWFAPAVWRAFLESLAGSVAEGTRSPAEGN